MNRPIVFVSYSHKNEQEKEKLLAHLGVLRNAVGSIELWSDDKIPAGGDWRAEISQTMTLARVAILLVTAEYLNSDFVLKTEVPTLLQRREREGLIVVPIIARACAWQTVDWLAGMNVKPKNGRPVWGEQGQHVDEDLAAITLEINEAIRTELIPHNLTTRDYERLVGRDEEIESILHILDHQSKISLASITGVNGVGRSALAREVAHRCLEFAQQHPADRQAFQGIIWISAHQPRLTSKGVIQARSAAAWTLDDLYLTMATVLRQQALIQARPEERAALIQELLQHGRYLLILDDVDKMSDPQLTDFLQTLPAPNKVVSISKAPLKVSGLMVPLSSLNPQAAIDLMQQETREGQVQPVEEASQAELHRLAEEAEGLPLAIRLAVALSNRSGQPVTEITNRMTRESGGRSLLEFLLHELAAGLSAEQSRLLQAFALYPQPTRAEAAGEAAGIHRQQLQPALDELVQLGLVQLDEPSGRYSMLPLMQGYALEELKADSNFKTQATYRALEFMREFAQTNAQPGDWAGMDRLEDEVGNLMWAARQAYELRQWRQLLHFRQILGDFLYWRGYWNEAIQVGKWAYKAADQLGDPKERAWCALYPLARVNYYQGTYEAAARWAKRSLNLFKREQDDYGIAAACRYLGRILQAQGDLERAQVLFTTGLKKARKFNRSDSDKNMQGYLLSALAGLAYEQQQFDQAEQRYQEALLLYQKTENQTGIADVYHRLGNIARQRRQYGRAEALLNDSLRAIENVGSGQTEAEILFSMALLAEEQGQLDLAQERLEQAQNWFRSLSATVSLNRTEAVLARISAAHSKQPRRKRRKSTDV